MVPLNHREPLSKPVSVIAYPWPWQERPPPADVPQAHAWRTGQDRRPAMMNGQAPGTTVGMACLPEPRSSAIECKAGPGKDTTRVAKESAWPRVAGSNGPSGPPCSPMHPQGTSIDGHDGSVHVPGRHARQSSFHLLVGGSSLSRTSWAAVSQTLPNFRRDFAGIRLGS
jgi:hypothetical protein